MKIEKRVLVIGGAGYIGSHACKVLNQQGYEPVVLDNLVTGHRWAVKWGPLIEASCLDTTQLVKTLLDHQISAVMHFAAFACVGESVADPAKYYENNVGGVLSVLRAMQETKVKSLVFSSTCATYGQPQGEKDLDESHPQQPINPYGRTKWICEKMIQDFSAAYGLSSLALRYFNAAGADPDAEIGEDHQPESHLIPLVIQAALAQTSHVTGASPKALLKVFGDNYPTPDGTCVRDYIHVMDLARAHVLGLKKLMAGHKIEFAYNLGTGLGQSVLEIIKAVEKSSQRKIPYEIVGRREGDPSRLVANPALAKKDLGWSAHYTDIQQLVDTAWNWENAKRKKS